MPAANGRPPVGGRAQGVMLEVDQRSDEQFRTPLSGTTTAEQRGKGRTQLGEGRPGISDKKQEATASIETKVQDDLERAMEREMVRIRSRNFGEEWQR